jgi:hypothetical protein
VTAADPNREPLENEKLTQAELARPQTFFHFRGAAAGQATLTLPISKPAHERAGAEKPVFISFNEIQKI